MNQILPLPMTLAQLLVFPAVLHVIDDLVVIFQVFLFLKLMQVVFPVLAFVILAIFPAFPVLVVMLDFVILFQVLVAFHDGLMFAETLVSHVFLVLVAWALIVFVLLGPKLPFVPLIPLHRHLDRID